MDTSSQLLVEQAKQEKLLFTEILALSERQLLLFRDSKINGEEIIELFNALIDQRQMIMNTIENLQASSLKEIDVEQERVQLYQELRQETEAVISSIQDHDREILIRAEQILNGFSEQLRTARNSKKAYQAYTGEDEPVGKGWFIDRKK